MPLSTHRVIQLARTLDNLEGLPSKYRRCASKLAGIGNRLGAIEYVNKAQKAERVLWKVRERLWRDEEQFKTERANATTAALMDFGNTSQDAFARR